MTGSQQQQVTNTVEKIKPLLAGLGPIVQSAVLADLLAMWLAGHAPAIRDDVLKLHIGLVRTLTDINEKIMFGEEGHPARHQQ